MDGKYRLAFPSWVRQGGIPDNAVYLCAQWERLRENNTLTFPCEAVPEISLCFFESKACLEYGRDDLPGKLAELPCTWHLHLPLDLPFSLKSAPTPLEVAESVDICVKLVRKCDFLNPAAVVLHPPAAAPSSRFNPDCLECFAELWAGHGLEPKRILLENQPGSELDRLMHISATLGFGLCYDFAHVYMGYATQAESTILQYSAQAGIWHINAPGPRLNGHAPLNSLSPTQIDTLKKALRHDRKERPVLLLELFNWGKIEQSLPILNACISRT